MKKPKPNFTIEDILLEMLGRTKENPDGYITALELAENLDISRSNLAIKIRELYRKGKIDMTFVRRPTIVGRIASVPAYRLKK